MAQRREFCSRCQKMQNLRESKTENIEINDEGQKNKIIIKSYHCEVCNLFVCCEEQKVSVIKE